MSRTPSDITFEYGQAHWPDNWFSLKIPKSSTATQLAAVKRYLSENKFVVHKEQVGKDIVMYGKAVTDNLWEASWQMKNKFSYAELRIHYHNKPATLRTEKEKEFIKTQREERKKRAPIVFGVPYILKDKDWRGCMTSIIVFYKQVKGRFCALRAEIFDNDRANLIPEWRLTRYGCHEVKNILKRCKVQDLAFMVLHGSLIEKASQIVDEQLTTWHLIKDVMDKAPRTATGREQELAKYEKGTECPVVSESTTS